MIPDQFQLVIIVPTFLESFDKLDNGKRQIFGQNGTGYLFATFMPDHLSIGCGLVNEV